MEIDELESVEEHRVDAFDRWTLVSLMNDGSIMLKVPSMPPSWPCRGGLDSFQRDLATELGVEVEGLDKELFRIAKPLPDTLPRLKALLVEIRRRHELKEPTS